MLAQRPWCTSDSGVEAKVAGVRIERQRIAPPGGTCKLRSIRPRCTGSFPDRDSSIKSTSTCLAFPSNPWNLALLRSLRYSYLPGHERDQQQPAGWKRSCAVPWAERASAKLPGGGELQVQSCCTPVLRHPIFAFRESYSSLGNWLALRALARQQRHG